MMTTVTNLLTHFLCYDLKVALLVVVFYGFYRLLVARDTFHRLNRLVLLCSLVLSLLLPLCHVTVHRDVLVPQESALSGLSPDGEDARVLAGGAVSETPSAGGDRVVLYLLGTLYLAGVLFCLARTYIRVLRVRQIIASGERREVPSYIAWRTPRMRLSVVNDDAVRPFSWMHTIVLSRKDYRQDLLDGQSGRSVILAHECGHVVCRHSFDTLFVDVIAALQWFNPVVWLLREELRTVHEYEADARVLSQGFNAYQYLNLLILKAAGDAGYSIANGISTSSALSKRVKMMLRHKSSKGSLVKLLYILPVVAMSLAATAKVVVNYKTVNSEVSTTEKGSGEVSDKAVALPLPVEKDATLSDIGSQDTPDGQAADAGATAPVEQIAEVPDEAEAVVDDDIVFSVVEQLPSFPGGNEKMWEFMRENLKYPKEAIENDIQGRVIVQFVVEKDGSLTHVKIVKHADSANSTNEITVNAYGQEDGEAADATDAASLGRLLDEEALRVVRLMPKWQPGRQQGRVVRTQFSIPIMFRLS